MVVSNRLNHYNHHGREVVDDDDLEIKHDLELEIDHDVEDLVGHRQSRTTLLDAIEYSVEGVEVLAHVNAATRVNPLCVLFDVAGEVSSEHVVDVQNEADGDIALGDMLELDLLAQGDHECEQRHNRVHHLHGA